MLSVQNGEFDIVHSSFILMTSDRNILKQCRLNCVCTVGVFQAVNLDVTQSTG